MNDVMQKNHKIDYQYFEPLHKVLQIYMAQDKIDRVIEAYEMGFIGHLTQTRSSGEPYITHPVAVATILANIFLDYQAIQAALLHDVIEDTSFTASDINVKFGPEVVEIVEGVSKLDKLKFRTRQEAEVANFTKMIMAMTKNVKVVLIKLADRLHNIRTIESLRPDKQRRIAKETLDIYSNIAGRLGIMSIKHELDELCFKAIYPNRFKVIQNVVAKLIEQKQPHVKKIVEEIIIDCANHSILVDINPQLRSLYRIYRGLETKEFNIRSDMDIFKFIVTVPDRIKCYEVLGILHNSFIPVHKSFADYIAIPKTNGYQSIHTTLRTSSGVEFQILIRTKEMDSLANNGILSNNTQDGENSDFTQISKWLNEITQLQQSTANINEFTQAVKSELFPNEVFVFTPQGKIIQLPEGSTTLDFAFYIHSDVGKQAVSSKVDGKVTKLSWVLSSGETVEIETDLNHIVSEQDLKLVHSSLARNKIKTFLRQQHQELGILKGKYHLTNALNGKDPNELPVHVINNALKYLGIASLDKLFLEIHLGNLISLVAAEAIEFELARDLPDNQEEIAINKYRLIDELIKRGFNIEQSKCCSPVPGDGVVLSSNSGKGLLIHYHKCNNIISNKISNFEKFSDVEWDNHDQRMYATQIRIVVNKNRFLLAKIIDSIVNNQSDLVNFSLETEDNEQLIIAIIEVSNKAHLFQIIDSIKHAGAESVERFINSN